MSTYMTAKLWRKTFSNTNEKNINIELEQWNEEYESMDISCETIDFKSRLAKKTSKKLGYLVVIWKKDSLNNNMPFNKNDIGDYLVVNILDDNNEGQFIFPVGVLTEKGIIQSEKSKRKNGF
ncbi:MepB family protein [Macrococcus capreoli]|uniref:MepB family protein n=1 Tax=Macrococcus capreoli TaxID=2982690 RepID=UPI003F444ABD